MVERNLAIFFSRVTHNAINETGTALNLMSVGLRLLGADWARRTVPVPHL